MSPVRITSAHPIRPARQAGRRGLRSCAAVVLALGLPFAFGGCDAPADSRAQEGGSAVDASGGDAVVSAGAVERRAVSSPAAPEAIGPYSQGVLVGPTLHLAGQIALDPETGELVEGGIEAETHRVMRNLEAVLGEAGLGLEDVVASQVFLADLDDFGAMNEIYGEYLVEPYPARATVEVARLPRDARVEIQFTAVRSAP